MKPYIQKALGEIVRQTRLKSICCFARPIGDDSRTMSIRARNQYFFPTEVCDQPTKDFQLEQQSNMSDKWI